MIGLLAFRLNKEKRAIACSCVNRNSDCHIVYGARETGDGGSRV